MNFKTKQKEVLTLFKPHEALLIEYIWKLNEGERTGIYPAQAYYFLSKLHEKWSIDSVNDSLDRMVDEGLLVYEEEFCTSGLRRIYFPVMDP